MLNQVHLIGRIGKSEFKTFGNPARRMGNISVATTKRIKDENQTTWHDVVVFGKTQEIAEKLLRVGDLVFIEGSISKKTVEKDGNKVTYHSIVCDRFDLIERSSKEKNQNAHVPDVQVDVYQMQEASFAAKHKDHFNGMAQEAKMNESKIDDYKNKVVKKDEPPKNTSFLDEIPF